MTFKDDTATERGIRVIPRTSPYGQKIGYRDAEKQAKSELESVARPGFQSQQFILVFHAYILWAKKRIPLQLLQ